MLMMYILSSNKLLLLLLLRLCQSELLLCNYMPPDVLTLISVGRKIRSSDLVNTHSTKNLLCSVSDVQVAIGPAELLVRLGHRLAVAHHYLLVH